MFELKPATATDEKLVSAGKSLWRKGDFERGIPACAGCHGPTGAGVPAQYPRIAGQYAEYTEAQLKNFRSEERSNDPEMMMRNSSVPTTANSSPGPPRASTARRCAAEGRRTVILGALIVLDGQRLAGMFSERDYARKVILQGKVSVYTKVGDIMTDKVISVTMNHTIEQCLAIMSEKHFRHLPVLDDEGLVVGIISIGDMVKEMISQQQFIINQLESYISS